MARRCIFISYARNDGPRVQKDAALLRAGGARVFIDTQDIEAGSPWEPALELALAKCERVLVFWSRAAKGSTLVDREWRMALRLGKRVIPALLDDTPLPPELAALQGITRSPDPGKALGTPKMQAVVWLGTAVVAAVVSWATLRMHGDTPPPSAALPPVAVVEPMRSASDAAIAAAAVDSVRDQALFLRSLIARAADDEPSATSLREGREKFVAAIQGLPIELMATSDLVRLSAETAALRAALYARGPQFPEDSATRRELRLLTLFLQTSATSAASPVEFGREEDRFSKFSVLAVLATLVLSLPFFHMWHKRRRARAFVDAIFTA